MIEIIERNIEPEDTLEVKRIYTKWERRFQHAYLFSPGSEIHRAVLNARDKGIVENEPFQMLTWAEDMGTVFRYTLVEPNEENLRGELYAEDIDIKTIEEETGMSENRILGLCQSLIDSGQLRSKNTKPNRTGFSRLG